MFSRQVEEAKFQAKFRLKFPLQAKSQSLAKLQSLARFPLQAKFQVPVNLLQVQKQVEERQAQPAAE